MKVVVNTPFEERMAAAFNLGAVIGGNSAGAAVQSRNMINGYVGNFGPENGFQQGTVDLWLYNGPTDDSRGLSFGIANVIFEQQRREQRDRPALVGEAAGVVGQKLALQRGGIKRRGRRQYPAPDGDHRLHHGRRPVVPRWTT